MDPEYNNENERDFWQAVFLKAMESERNIEHCRFKADYALTQHQRRAIPPTTGGYIPA